ncbi:hypothetical protein SORBI_3002G298201 [Sorghum bicolor]|uniref:PAZ domain-containing protein n=1 Tax=Sorghum bicolor TaxID=4558 RepID=A0A1W0W6B9_SORBI|nr:hypothetical protein SORBI_3002G298201 [Sorghum bicolor]
MDKVAINHAPAISLLQLRMLLAGYPTDIPTQAPQVLETVLGDVLFNERDDIERIPIGPNDRTLGVEAWNGLYQSIRSTRVSLSLIADVYSSILVQPLLLIDFVQKILKIDVDRNLTEPEYDKLLKALRDVQIEVTHRHNKHHKYRIVGLSVKPTIDLSSESPSGATKTVTDHFRERYILELKYKSLPCINVGSEQKPIYLPIEVCKIVPRQCYQKNLECSQVSTLKKSASIQPEPEQSCHQVVDRKHTKCANEFGIEFDDNLTTVDARVLLPPNLKYHDSGSLKAWYPMNGHWNMKDKKVINGAKISNWACVNFCEVLSKKAIEEFCFKLAEMSRIIGADFANLKLPIFTARSDEVEHDICIYGYPIEIQALFFMAMRCALSWLDFGTNNDIYCTFDFMAIHGGYFIGNVGPAMDFLWFFLGIFVATLSSLATGEQAKAIMDIVEECWQRPIGEMPLKICYPAMENQIITGCGPKNTRWSYDNKGSWPDAAREALRRSIVYLRGQPMGTVAAIDKSQGAELSDAKLGLGPHGFSPKQLMDIVRKMSVSNKVTICLDKSEDGSDDMFLKSFQAAIGAARLWCLKYSLHYDFSHIYGATVFYFTTPPGGTFYITLEFEGRSITLLLAGRDLYIKGWRDESHGSFEIRMEECAAYMLGEVKVMNIEKNYSFLSTSGRVGGTRIGPEALREAFNILFKYKGERCPEVRRAIGVFAVNFPEAIRIQKVYKTVVRSFLNSEQQVLDPIPEASDEQTQPDPEDTNTLWIENCGHYSHQAMLDANARDSETNPPGISNRDGANVESATEIFREIRVGLRDACPKAKNELKPQKIEDPDDEINQSRIPKPKPITRKKRRRKGKVPDLEEGDGQSAESVALFLLEDWLPEDDDIDDDETRKQKGSDLEGGDGESEDDEIADDKQASKAKEVEGVNFSVAKFLERRMEEKIQTMRISEWLSKKLQKTENFHQISQFNAEKATVKKFIPPKPHTSMLQRNTLGLGQRLMHRVSRCLRFL